MKNNRIYIIALILGLFLTNAKAQDGATIFDDNCAACHKMGMRLVGPDLEGVTDRRSEEWVKAFIANSTALIESGDADAKAIFEEYKIPMTAFEDALSDDEMTALVDYLKSTSPNAVAQEGETAEVEEGAAGSINKELATAGGSLFDDNCSACHKMGIRLVGPDLVGVTDRRKEDWIKSFIKNSTALIESGDADAKAIFEEYKIPMTSFESLSDDDLSAIVEYLKASSVPAPAPKVEAKKTVAKTPTTPVVAVKKPAGPLDIISNVLYYFAIGFVVIMLLLIMGGISTFLGKNMTEEELNSSFANKFFAMFSGDFRVFTGNYTESTTEGHSYDGIRELDNTMPPWLQGIFYITIFWAIVYVLNYFVINPQDTQLKEYQDEMAAAAEKYGDMDALKVDITLVTDAGKLDAAKEIFVAKCAACHLADGGGSVGPNLTDEFWINGGSIEDVFNTIRTGVPAKGMISWKGQLSDAEILDVASYIKNLKGTTPAKAKEAQGDKYVGE